MKILNYKPVQKNTLHAVFTLVVPEWQSIQIRECCYFIKGNNRWIGFPTRMYEKDGEKKYWPYVAFANMEDEAAFKAQVLHAIDVHLKSATMSHASPVEESVPF